MLSKLLPLGIHSVGTNKRGVSLHPIISEVQDREYASIVEENRWRVIQLIDVDTYTENKKKIELLNRVFSALFSSFSIVYPSEKTDLDKEVQFHKASIRDKVMNMLPRSKENFYFHIDVNNLDMYFPWISKVLDTYPHLSQLVSDEDHILIVDIIESINKSGGYQSDKINKSGSYIIDKISLSIIGKKSLENKLTLDIHDCVTNQGIMNITPQLDGTIQREIVDFRMLVDTGRLKGTAVDSAHAR